MSGKKWSVWKTVKVGCPGLRDAEDFLQRFVKEDPCHDKCFEALIQAMVPDLITEEKEIKLVLVSLRDLGFSDETTKKQCVFDLLPEVGLGLVPAVAGFCLRDQYAGQSEDEKFHIAMKPYVLPKFGCVGLFLFGRWITADCADYTSSLSPECQFACSIVE